MYIDICLLLIKTHFLTNSFSQEHKCSLENEFLNHKILYKKLGEYNWIGMCSV